ncbi:SerB Phosphoserine phosphatase [Candidatus Nanopelagicaceae bacterium]
MTIPKRLVQMDVDSTFIQQEAIELLAAKAGVLAEVALITESAMRGELDFEESLRARVLLLSGLSESVIADVRSEILLTDGAAELVETLHAKGHCVALVSGGFIDILQPLVNELKIKHYKANKLDIVDGVLTGKVVGKIIDRAAKATALREFAAECEVDLKNTVAIGDGANDLDMMEIAGISIAFKAKPIVAAAADHSINEPSLKSVLTLIGEI